MKRIVFGKSHFTIPSTGIMRALDNVALSPPVTYFELTTQEDTAEALEQLINVLDQECGRKDGIHVESIPPFSFTDLKTVQEKIDGVIKSHICNDVKRLFSHVIVTSRICSFCQTRRVSLAIQDKVELPISPNDDMTDISLLGLLGIDMKTEKLEGVYCETCKGNQDCEQIQEFGSLPEILVFHAKRFSQGSITRRGERQVVPPTKNKRVVFPDEEIEISTVNNHTTGTYNLMSVSLHNDYVYLTGAASSTVPVSSTKGHYTTDALFNGTRWKFDDNGSTRIQLDAIKQDEADDDTKNGYVFYYSN
jgi:ubiquitin C-terminal hydrolase